MRRPDRSALIYFSLVIFAGALVVRAAQVQLWQRRTWEARAERQHFTNAPMPAARGNIFDVSGVPLAQTRELVRISVAPKEVKSLPRLARDLRRAGVDREWIAKATDAKRAWVQIPHQFQPRDVETLANTAGVYAERLVERDYTPRYATRRILGRVGDDGKPVDGLELALDSVLHGQRGHAVVLRDARGAKPASPADTSLAPEQGDDVVLTISQELQEIAERALTQTVTRTGATGGDILILEPSTGEIRAMTSVRRDPRSSGSPLLSEPYEPGSTMKPFIAATLLEDGKAHASDVIGTENGTYEIAGRTLHDEHPAAQRTLADVIRYSSNIGIAKFAQRLSHAEEFEALRDFGFGTPTGISFPKEASGRLPSPANWSPQTPASLAIGYEISVTALQLATAYAALANGGELLEPTLVQEIRAPDGRVRYRHVRRVVRRVLEPAVAETVRRMLIGAVEGGTATQAGLGNFQVAGKTGTARRTQHGRYVDSAYTASFVGLFPAEHPQYVILVKIDNPAGNMIFGGKAAAPVSRVVLEAAIAARDAALDRNALAEAAPPPAKPAAQARTTVAANSPSVDSNASRIAQITAQRTSVTADSIASIPFVASIPLRSSSPMRVREPRAVPEVRGLPLRDAVRELHRAGFRVQLAGFGAPMSTSPSAGAMAMEGSTIRLLGAP